MSHSFAWIVVVALLGGTGAGCKSEQAAQAAPVTATSQSKTEGAGAKDKSAPLNGFDGMPAVGTKAKCPVMGTDFAVTKETQSSVYKGKTYVFCCPSCKPQFDANPEKYLGS